MKIKFREYTLEPESRNYNLYKTVTTVADRDTKNQKKGLSYESEKNLGWGLRFETAVEIIVKDMMEDRDVVVTLREYIDEYRKLREEVLISTNI